MRLCTSSILAQTQTHTINSSQLRDRFTFSFTSVGRSVFTTSDLDRTQNDNGSFGGSAKIKYDPCISQTRTEETEKIFSVQ